MARTILNYLRQFALRDTDKDLKLPLRKINNGQKGYSFRGAKSWNGLSAGANVHHLRHLLRHICKSLFYISSFMHL